MRAIPWKRGRRAFLFLGATVAAAVVSGCGDGKPSVETSTAEATVQGVVKVHGKPTQGGTVSFNPANYRRPVGAVQAAIGKDGRYVVKTLVGKNQVNVDSPEVRKEPELGYQFLTIDVQAGENTINIDLPPP